MYTLRFFEQLGEVDRHQIYLGESYSVKKPSEKDEKDGIVCRVLHGKDSDGFAIYKSQYAFIMSPNGQTFETLNRPLVYQGVSKPKRENANLVLEHVNDMCVESLSPESFENWGNILKELRINRSDLNLEPLKGQTNG